MITYDEAIAITHRHALTPRSEIVPIGEALGATVTEQICAGFPSPRFDSSAMDGYAVGSAGSMWKVVGESAAGQTTIPELGHGEAVRVFTGARIPSGSYAVIPQEDVHVHDGVIQVEHHAQAGAHIRHAGEEFPAGRKIIDAGTLVTPLVLSTLASLGITKVQVAHPPSVAILTTGSELVRLGTDLAGSQVYESNSWGLRAALELERCSVTTQHVPDDRQETADMLATLVERHDVVLTVGGVSVGSYDHVADAAKALGAHVHFSRVAMKPGKPVTFGTFPSGCHWFGLPGNPMSAWTTYLMLARALWAPLPTFHRMVLSNGFERTAGREDFAPVRFIQDLPGHIEVLASVGSHATSLLHHADGFARINASTTSMQPGNVVPVYTFPRWLRG